MEQDIGKQEVGRASVGVCLCEIVGTIVKVTKKVIACVRVHMCVCGKERDVLFDVLLGKMKDEKYVRVGEDESDLAAFYDTE